jgi:hypothetical protein
MNKVATQMHMTIPDYERGEAGGAIVECPLVTCGASIERNIG